MNVKGQIYGEIIHVTYIPLFQYQNWLTFPKRDNSLFKNTFNPIIINKL